MCLRVLVVKFLILIMKKEDEKFMRRAIELALRGKGYTSPNPIVGGVVVKNGKVVGEGYHRKAGAFHAEVMALKNAGRKSVGADLYVTLEPCCHYGKTPPCSEAIIESKVKRVIIGTRDPNPLVKGRGVKALKGAHLKVTEGVLRDECRRLNAPYDKWIVSGVPFVILKAALSLDGKISTARGESKWITNNECRQYVHHLRSSCDAILVGRGTVIKDNPRLNVRLSGKKINPKLAIVLDEDLSLSPTSKLFRRRKGELIIATTSRSPLKKRKYFERKGHQVLLCRSSSEGRVFLPHLLQLLGSLGINSLLVEGGGKVFADFMKRNLADKVVACIAPKIIGGKGRDWLPGYSIADLKSAFNLENVDIRVFKDNVVIEGEV